MDCPICKQPTTEKWLSVNGHRYHTSCYIEEFGVPADQVERLVGKSSSRIRKARMSLLTNEGAKETHDAFEIDWYRQRRGAIDPTSAISDPQSIRKKMRRKLRNKDRMRKRRDWLEFVGSLQDHTGFQEGGYRINQSNRE